MIDKSFIEKIEEMVKPVLVTAEGRQYSTEDLHPVKDPQPASLRVVTLTAIADYLTANPDELDLSKVVAHISGSRQVEIRSTLYGSFQQRDVFLDAAPAKRPEFPFGQPVSVDTFIVCLQSYFVQTDTTANLIKVVGNLTDEKVTNYDDDGVSQKVTARTGIARVGEVKVPNPVVLAPFRTFLEIDQPESTYVFRIQGGTPPSCSLHQADGGSWELEAIKRISAWLKENIPEGVVILA